MRCYLLLMLVMAMIALGFAPEASGGIHPCSAAAASSMPSVHTEHGIDPAGDVHTNVWNTGHDTDGAGGSHGCPSAVGGKTCAVHASCGVFVAVSAGMPPLPQGVGILNHGKPTAILEADGAPPVPPPRD